MKQRTLLLLLIISIFATNQLSAQIFGKITSPTPLETSSALKQALDIGVKKAVDILSKENGFLADKEVRIAFPNDIKRVDQTLRSVGLGEVSDDFIKQLNTGAEKAVGLAAPILLDAIRTMTFEDASKILLGGNGAATKYFQTKTNDSLYAAFKPKVKEVLDQYGVSKSYSSLMSEYNAIPFVRKANTDLNDYVTRETLKGLFIKLAEEGKQDQNGHKSKNHRPPPKSLQLDYSEEIIISVVIGSQFFHIRITLSVF